DITISADVDDDLGLKSTPIIYYSTTPPATPPDLTAMQQVVTTRTAGDALSGTYEGTIPNPVATSPPNTKKTIYYLIEARDNDDPTGPRAHVTHAPATGTYSFDVTNPGSVMGTLMACDPCTSDVQCTMGYECIAIGTGGGTFCQRECTGSPPCATGYSCSSS